MLVLVEQVVCLCVSLSTFPTLRLYMARLFSFLSTFAQVTL